MNSIFKDRRGGSKAGRITLVVTWTFGALLFALGIPVLGTVFFYSVSNLSISDFLALDSRSQAYIMLIGLAFMASTHATASLLYVIFQEFPKLIGSIDKESGKLLIKPMIGNTMTYSPGDFEALNGEAPSSFCWYKPWSLAVTRGRPLSILKLRNGDRWLIPYETDLEELRAKFSSTPS